MTRPLSIGIAGLGTVGGGVMTMLRQNADLIAARAGRPIAVTAVSARDRTRDRGMDLSGLRWYDDPVALAGDANVDVVVEVIGGSEGPAPFYRKRGGGGGWVGKVFPGNMCADNKVRGVAQNKNTRKGKLGERVSVARIDHEK